MPNRFTLENAFPVLYICKKNIYNSYVSWYLPDKTDNHDFLSVFFRLRQSLNIGDKRKRPHEN